MYGLVVEEFEASLLTSHYRHQMIFPLISFVFTGPADRDDAGYVIGSVAQVNLIVRDVVPRLLFALAPVRPHGARLPHSAGRRPRLGHVVVVRLRQPVDVCWTGVEGDDGGALVLATFLDRTQTSTWISGAWGRGVGS